MVPAVPTGIELLHNLVNGVCDMTGWLLPSPQSLVFVFVCVSDFFRRQDSCDDLCLWEQDVMIRALKNTFKALACL